VGAQPADWRWIPRVPQRGIYSPQRPTLTHTRHKRSTLTVRGCDGARVRWCVRRCEGATVRGPWLFRDFRMLRTVDLRMLRTVDLRMLRTAHLRT
jgi:hypothetical protein